MPGKDELRLIARVAAFHALLESDHRGQVQDVAKQANQYADAFVDAQADLLEPRDTTPAPADVEVEISEDDLAASATQSAGAVGGDAPQTPAGANGDTGTPASATQLAGAVGGDAPQTPAGANGDTGTPAS